MIASLGLASDKATKTLVPRAIPFSGIALPAVKPCSRTASRAFLEGEKFLATRASGMTPAASWPGRAVIQRAARHAKKRQAASGCSALEFHLRRRQRAVGRIQHQVRIDEACVNRRALPLPYPGIGRW